MTFTQRKRYGDNWLTIFPSGLEIPWRKLTLQEFIQFEKLFRSGKYSAVEVEDFIFSAAVLERLYIDNIDILPSGIVSTVAAQIFQCSGPFSPQAINQDLDVARNQVQDFISGCIPVICSVFPAYKPEDLLALDYLVFMERLAMAESRLLQIGVLKTPLQVLIPENEEEDNIDPPATSIPLPPPMQQKPSSNKRLQIQQKLQDKFKNLNTKHPEGVITDNKIKTTEQYIPDLSVDPRDQLLNQIKIDKVKQKAIEDLEVIYPEYFELMKAGKKLSPEVIQSVKGSTNQQIKAKHQEYISKLQSGEIKLPEPKQETPKPTGRKKIIVKRQR